MADWKETKCGKCKIQRSSPICNSCEKFDKFQPQTNYDRIQNMSIEEMAESRIDMYTKGEFEEYIGDFNGIEFNKEDAIKKEIDWLQAESEE